MHEHSFIEAILRNVEDRDNVRKIVLEVGELAGIEAGHLREHIETQLDSKHRTGQGKVDVEVLSRNSKVRCECGFEGRAKVLERLHDLVIFECPECEGIPEVLEGKDIKILKVVYN